MQTEPKFKRGDLVKLDNGDDIFLILGIYETNIFAYESISSWVLDDDQVYAICKLHNDVSHIKGNKRLRLIGTMREQKDDQ